MKVIAFYLPQFHPVRENNEWWGKGFTEWNNVVKARPRFKGHYQPHLPADLGFYDLRTEETKEAQAKMALEYGVNAFCYHHYWFSGRLILERPAQDLLRRGTPTFPFLFSWANENWSRAWDGQESSVLLKQDYSVEDYIRHIEYLAPFFRDERYVRHGEKPVFMIYRPDHIPDIAVLVEIWQTHARKLGLESGLHLVAVNGSGMPQESEKAWISSGFDAICDFQPRSTSYPKLRGKSRVMSLVKKWLPSHLYGIAKQRVRAEKVIPYEALVNNYRSMPWPSDYTKYPCVFPSWDNTARRKSSVVIQNTDPGLFRKFFQAAFEKAGSDWKAPQYIFVNAWNEWAEGCHLEPDQLIGTGFLEQIRLQRGSVG